MKYITPIAIIITFLTTLNTLAQTADFYIAPNGSPNYSGTLPTPNPQKTDGPFLTLTQAKNAIRNLKNSKPNKNLTVLIREGTYTLNKTVVFTTQDSANPNTTITYAAYPNETPTFTSAQKITGWQKAPANLPNLPQAAQGKVYVANVNQNFHSLFDTQGLLPRAQSKGFIPLSGGSTNSLKFPQNTLKNWTNLQDIEILVRPHHAWITNILPLASVNEQTQTATTSTSATYAMNKLHFLKSTNACWVQNAIDFIDQPGEWALDTTQNKLYLWPRNNAAPQNILFPTLNELIRIEGDINKQGPIDVPVTSLTFQGLTFKHAKRFTLTNQLAGLQHDWDFHDTPNSLLRLRGAQNITIQNCTFTHSASSAIRLDLHAQQNTLASNHISQLGGAGILLAGYGPGTKNVNKNNTLYNNNIHHLGLIYPHSPGIMIWQSGDNTIANNLIHHTPYTGLIISGFMTHFFERSDRRELVRTARRHEIEGDIKPQDYKKALPYLHTRNNIIELNEIHHTMQQLADGNAIYIRGAGPNNIIRQNYIHHQLGATHMQAAIRTDGGQRDTLISQNIIYKCMAQGIILKLNNRCENNIIADIIEPPRGYYLSLREGPMTGATIKNNIFYATSKNATFFNELTPRNKNKSEDSRGRPIAYAHEADTNNNIYYNTANPQQAKNTLTQNQHNGIDQNSLATDPLFINPAKGDFRLQPNSPAHKLKITPLDLTKVGLQN